MAILRNYGTRAPLQGSLLVPKMVDRANADKPAARDY